MAQSMGAIVACLQQIELAIQQLENNKESVSADLFEGVKEKMKTFFKETSVENGIAVYEACGELESVFEIPVQVDGLKTTLRNCLQELEEVIEDFASEADE